MADGLPLHLYVALSSELNTISCKFKQGVIAHVICSDLFILPLRYLLAVRLSLIQFLHVTMLAAARSRLRHQWMGISEQHPAYMHAEEFVIYFCTSAVIGMQRHRFQVKYRKHRTHHHTHVMCGCAESLLTRAAVLRVPHGTRMNGGVMMPVRVPPRAW